MLRTMRTPLLATILGLSLAGCLTIGDSGSPTTGGGGDDGTGTDGTGSNHQGSGAIPSTAQVDVSVDKAALSTELKTVNPITITVKGSGGFSGSVGLTAAVVDGNQNPIADWTVDLSAPSVSLAENGTSTATATVHIPALSSTLTGTLKVTTTSAATLGTTAASSTLTAANQVTFLVKYDPATMDCVYPADGGTVANGVKVAQATKIRFFNNGADNIVIHVTSNNGTPISHQGQAPNGGPSNSTTLPNTAYEQTPIGTGPATWYCHDSPTGAKDHKADDPRILVQ